MNNLNTNDLVIKKINNFIRIKKINNVAIDIISLILIKRINETNGDLFENEHIQIKLPKGGKHINTIKLVLSDKIQANILDNAIKILQKNDKSLFVDFENFFKDISFDLNTYSKSDFGELFSNIIANISYFQNQNTYFTPQPLSVFLSMFIKLKTEDNVFDPFAGSASLITNIPNSNQVKANYYLNDINKDIVYVGCLNMLLNGINNFKYVNTDSISDYYSNQKIKQKFEWIITDAPLDLFKEKNSSLKSLESANGIRNNDENHLIELILNMLSNNGKAIIIVPEKFCYSTDKESIKLRKKLVDNDLIEWVISLPLGVNNAYRTKTALLILNNNKPNYRKKIITFCDISNRMIFNEIYNIYHELSFDEMETELMKGKSNANIYKIFLEHFGTNTSFNKISKNKYLLIANKYIYTEENNPYTIENKKKLKDVIEKVTIGKKIPEESLSEFYGNVYYLTEKNLKVSQDNIRLQLDDSYVFVKDTKYLNHLLETNSVLISRDGLNLNPTLFNFDEKCAINNNIIALQVNINIILPRYLITQLNSWYFKYQMKGIINRGLRNKFEIKDFLQTIISVPTIEEQEKFLKEFNYKRVENTLNNLDIKENFKLGTGENMLMTLRHEYLNRIKPLEGLSLLKKYLENKINSGEKILWNDSITSSSKSSTLIQKIEELQRTVESLNKLFIDIPDIFKFDKKPNLKKVNIKDFIKNKLDSLHDELDKNNIEYSIKGKNIVCKFDMEQFEYVILNFVSNSIKHAFEDNQTYKTINIELLVSEDDKYIYIDYKDNGKGFPDGFTIDNFISFAQKTGKNAGSGIGGFLINKIVSNHGGKIELITDKTLLAQYNTFFRIYLPRKVK